MLLAALLGPMAFAMPGHPNWGPAEGRAGRLQIEKALKLIPTSAGNSAWERMFECTFKIEWSVSSFRPSRVTFRISITGWARTIQYGDSPINLNEGPYC